MAANGSKVAYGGSRCVPPPRRCVVNFINWTLEPCVCVWGGPPGTHCTEAGWTSEPIWTLWRTKKTFAWALELS